MADTRFDILGIGNAIVDVVARADDAFLSRLDGECCRAFGG